MIYTQSSLNIYNPYFSNYTYLTEQESNMIESFNTIPVIENSRLGVNLVDYNNIERLLETTCYSVNEIIDALIETNNLDSLTVAVDDYKLILHPEIIDEISNIVIKPLSKNDPAYIFTEACLDKFMETMDESYIDYLTTIHEYYKEYGKELARKASETTKKALQKEFDSYNVVQDYYDDPTNEDKKRKYQNADLPLYFGKHALFHRKKGFDINNPYSKDKKERKKIQKVIKKMYKNAYTDAKAEFIVKHHPNTRPTDKNAYGRAFNTKMYRGYGNGPSPSDTYFYKDKDLKEYLKNEHLVHQGKSLTGKYNKTPLKSENDSDLDEPIIQTSNLPDLDEILDRKNQSVKNLENITDQINSIANMDISRQVKYLDKNFIAKQIQHLNNWARKMESKLNSPEKRSIWQKIKALVYKAINKLTKLLGADDKLTQLELDTAKTIGSLKNR